MTIVKDKMVSLTYNLRLDGKEGEIFETAAKENPLIFLYGAGMMLPGEYFSREMNSGSPDTYCCLIKQA